MGMYTQVRGFLCCRSIGFGEGTGIQFKLKDLQKEFLERKDLDRPWVCKDTVWHRGSNGSEWLFIGSEHKNYDNSMLEWIKTLHKEIPCEGRIEFQYENEDCTDKSLVLLVTKEEIKQAFYINHTYGYGFS